MGARLRRARLQRRLTWEELSRKAEVPVASLMELERDEAGITTAGTLRRIAAALEKTVEELFFEV